MLTGALALAFFYAFVYADFVGDGSSACSCRAADECSFASAEEATHDCTACRGTYDNLGSGVVGVVMRSLGTLGAVVAALGGGLRCAGDGER